MAAEAASAAQQCLDHTPPSDCGELAIVVPDGVQVNQLKGKANLSRVTKRQLTSNRSKKYKKKKKKKRNRRK